MSWKGFAPGAAAPGVPAPNQQQWQQQQQQQQQVAAAAAAAAPRQGFPQGTQPQQQPMQASQQQMLQQQAAQHAAQQAAAQQAAAAAQQQQQRQAQAQQQAQWQQQAQGGQQAAMQRRPGMPGGAPGMPQAANQVQGAASGQAPAQPQGETYVVVTKGSDTDQVVVRTLVGEYVEQGSNHGRKVYKKTSDKGPDAVDVFLYYWDNRDGPSFEGWWFGNKLGGTQVWSHCTGGSLQPPSAGWKIPWDGAVRSTLAVLNKEVHLKAEAEEKYKGFLGEFNEAQTAAKEAAEKAKASAGDYTEPEALQKAEEMLQPSVKAVNEVAKKVADASRGAGEYATRMFSQLANQITVVQTAMNEEMGKVKAGRNRLEQAEKEKVAEEKDMVHYNEILPEATSKTNAAEDAVEKALITSEMIAAGGEDLDEVQAAVAQTEGAAQEAQKAIGEARIFLNAKQVIARRFESEKIRTQATTELGKMQTQLQEAMTKLSPLKNVRQDFANRMAAQKMAQEILEKLTPAEVDVDRAEEVTALLSGDSLSKELLKQAEQAVAKAVEHVTSAAKFIEQKKKGATGAARDELDQMEERAKGSQKRLQQLKDSCKEASERVVCQTLLTDAGEKLTQVTEAVSKAADAESPFLMGVEELPLEDTLTAVKACETAATTANTAISVARAFVATKKVEAKRFSKGPSEEAQEKLQEFQKQLDGSFKRLTELKATTAKRKSTALMREAEAEVSKAEALVKQVAEAANVFADDSKLMEMAADSIRGAAEETNKAEVAASAALADARKFITARQIEAKGKENAAEVSAELIKFQTRLSTAQAQVSKFKRIASTVEQRLAAKRVIEDANSKLKGAEEKVQKVADLVQSLDDENGEPTDELDGEEKGPKFVERSAAEAQVALKAVVRFIESQTRTQGIAKEEILKMMPAAKKAQEKLDGVQAALRERSEKALIRGIVSESEKMVKEAENCVQKVSEAEKPLARGEELPAEQVSGAISELETALQTAHAAVGSAKTLLAMKRMAAKRLAESAAKATTEELAKLQVRLDAVTKKLADAKKGMAQGKQTLIKREVAATIADAEKKVQASGIATKVLSENGEIPTEQMQSACEKAGTAQQEAQATLTNARVLLMNRQKEAKMSSLDAMMIAEITKAIEKIVKMIPELEKQKALLRDQEHKFVASRLLSDAAEMVDKLEKKLESTSEAVSTMIADQKDDFTSTICLTHIITLVKEHLRNSSKNAKALFDQLSNSGENVQASAFISFFKALPEVTGQSEIEFTDESLTGAFKRMDGTNSGSVTEQEFLEQFRNRFVCNVGVTLTDTAAVKGGKTIRKLDVHEVVEGLEEPARDEMTGLLRMKSKAEKDEKEGYVTLAGNQGTIYLEPMGAVSSSQKNVDKAVMETMELVRETTKYIDGKCEELKQVKTGPLAETKGELLKLKPRVHKVQLGLSQQKKSVADAIKKHKEFIEEEKRKRQEAADKKVAAAMIEEAAEQATSLQAKVDEAMKAAEALTSSKGADSEDPLKDMEAAEKTLETVLTSIEEASAKAKSNLDTINRTAKGPLAEAKSTLVKHKVKVGSFETKCTKQIKALKDVRKQVETEAHTAVMEALRAHVKGKDMTPDALFAELSKDGKGITLDGLKGFISAIPNHGLKASKLDLGLSCYRTGVSKLSLLSMLKEYQKCVKDIAITSAFDLKTSKTARKLHIGEIVEVLEAGKVDEASGLERIKCCAIEDGLTGYVSIRGNMGASFLAKCAKPYLCCMEEAQLHSGFESSSPETRAVKPGEVFELLQGPKKEPPLETQRVRGKACKDGKMGFVTFKGVDGSSPFEPAKLFICKQSIALTTELDIAVGKPLRKLELGELIEVIEEATEDTKRALLRAKVKAKKDGKEGFITVKRKQILIGSATAVQRAHAYSAPVNWTRRGTMRFASTCAAVAAVVTLDVLLSAPQMRLFTVMSRPFHQRKTRLHSQAGTGSASFDVGSKYISPTDVDSKLAWDSIRQLRERLLRAPNLPPWRRRPAVDNPGLLWWFLKDRKLNVDEAAKKLERCLRWRHRFRVDGLGPELFAKEVRAGKGYVHEHTDIAGRPVLVAIARRHNIFDRDLLDSSRMCAWMLETALDRLDMPEPPPVPEDASTKPGVTSSSSQGPPEQALGIFDLRNFSPLQADLEVAGFLIEALYSYYPGRTARVLLVGAPDVFRIFWENIRPLLGHYSSLADFVTVDDVQNHYFAPGMAPSEFKDDARTMNINARAAFRQRRGVTQSTQTGAWSLMAPTLFAGLTLAALKVKSPRRASSAKRSKVSGMPGPLQQCRHHDHTRGAQITRHSAQGGLGSRQIGSYSLDTYTLDAESAVRCVEQLRGHLLRLPGLLKWRGRPAAENTGLLWWFLRDRHFDVSEAAAKLEKCLKWRKEFHVEKLGPELFHREMRAKKAYLHKHTDMAGRPVLMVFAQRHNVMDRDLRQSCCMCAWFMERIMDKLATIDPSDFLQSSFKVSQSSGDEGEGEQPVEQALGVIDLRGFSPLQADVEFVHFMITVLHDYYPDRFARILLVDAPSGFASFWDKVRPLLHRYSNLADFVTAEEACQRYFTPGTAPTELMQR